MSVFTATKPANQQSKVHYSQYLVTEDTPKQDDDTKPAEQPINPEQPEAE